MATLDPDLERWLESLHAVHETKWRVHAACKDKPVELFFDENSVQQAKRVCHTCPVRVECLDDAIKHDDMYCVRGGLTDKERRKVQRHRSRYRPLVPR